MAWRVRGWYWSAIKLLGTLKSLRGPRDVLFFFRVLGFAACVPALMRLRVSHLQHILYRPAAGTPDTARVEQIIAYVAAIMRLGRPFIRRGCLTRGVTLCYFLRSAGLDVSLSFGIGHEGDQFVGHCWLARDGEPIFERRDPRCQFKEVFRIPLDSNVSTIGLQPENTGRKAAR
jgi:Transglutaminase-like superfamily